MNTFFEKITAVLSDHTVELKKESYLEKDNLRAIYCLVDGTSSLILDGTDTEEFEGNVLGEKETIKVCPLSHANRLLIGKAFPHLAPQAFGREVSTFGFGDRLGIAGPGHLDAVQDTAVKPILSQQSLRELGLSGRAYDDVLDAATWAAFMTGYQGGFGADGDHLKTLEEVKNALKNGVSMITLDGSLVLKAVPEEESEIDACYAAYPKAWREEIEAEYKADEILSSLGLSMNQDLLKKIVIAYSDLIDLSVEAERCMKESGRAIDFELSLDETEAHTSPEAHYFVAKELQKKGVTINSMAPRFVGEFQKGIDYIGDREEFRQDIRIHCKIADVFGYKISLHSGSDKFSVFPIVAEESGRRFHVKTSGTSWLEAVRVIAEHDPKLYRDMHHKALEAFSSGAEHYHVKCDRSNIPDVDTLSDEALQDLMNEEDARQLIHITYGFIIQDENLHDRIFEDLTLYQEEYRKGLEKHFKRHLDLLK